MEEEVAKNLQCKCGAKVQWLTQWQIQSRINKICKGMPQDQKVTIRLPKQSTFANQNIFDEQLWPICSFPACAESEGGILSEARMLRAQNGGEMHEAIQAVVKHGSAVQALLAEEDDQHKKKAKEAKGQGLELELDDDLEKARQETATLEKRKQNGGYLPGGVRKARKIDKANKDEPKGMDESEKESQEKPEQGMQDEDEEKEQTRRTDHPYTYPPFAIRVQRIYKEETLKIGDTLIASDQPEETEN